MTKIDIWECKITGEKYGYLEESPSNFIDILQDMIDGSSYTITKRRMDEEEFNSLPEFQGF